MPSVSVIIPAFNAEKFVAEAVQSVLDQTIVGVECIVVNDGSSDNTAEVLSGFGGLITVVNQQNAGVSAARNVGIKAANGEWLAFLDADDVWEPTKLAVQLSDLKNYPEAKIHSTNLAIERNHLAADNFFELIGLPENSRQGIEQCAAAKLIKYHFAWLQSTLVHRSLISNEDDFFNSNISLYEDFEWLLNLATKSPWVLSPEVLVAIKRRENANDCLSASRERDEIGAVRLMIDILHRAKNKLTGDTAGSKELSRALVGQYSFLGSLYRRNGDRGMATRTLWRGFVVFRSPKLLAKFILAQVK